MLKKNLRQLQDLNLRSTVKSHSVVIRRGIMSCFSSRLTNVLIKIRPRFLTTWKILTKRVIQSHPQLLATQLLCGWVECLPPNGYSHQSCLTRFVRFLRGYELYNSRLFNLTLLGSCSTKMQCFSALHPVSYGQATHCSTITSLLNFQWTICSVTQTSYFRRNTICFLLQIYNVFLKKQNIFTFFFDFFY